MRLRFAVLLPLISIVVEIHGQTLNPSWAGLWKEDAAKSQIFFPGTLLIEAAPGGEYIVKGPEGQRSRIECASGPQGKQSCYSQRTPPSIQNHPPKSGTDYQLNDTSTALEVDNWRIVPDGSRLIDIDTYARSGKGTGFAGQWHKKSSTEAPTIYRVSIEGDRMTFATPDGELNVNFSVREAHAAKGSYYAFNSVSGNIYTIPGPSKIVERSLLRGKLVAKSLLTLSPDGKILTEDHTTLGATHTTAHIMYERDVDQGR